MIDETVMWSYIVIENNSSLHEEDVWAYIHDAQPGASYLRAELRCMPLVQNEIEARSLFSSMKV